MSGLTCVPIYQTGPLITYQTIRALPHLTPRVRFSTGCYRFWVVLRERADRHGARDAYEVVYSDMHADIDIEATLAHLGGVTMFQAMPRSPTCIRWAVTCQGPCGPSGCDFLHTDRLMLTQRPDLVAALRDTTSQAAKMTALELRSDWESFFKSSVQQGAHLNSIALFQTHMLLLAAKKSGTVP
ncbi:hypothetical protein K438DRAFT_1975079 [Mycena galopus ATCC 62051]|nr:hypothetical protein K438DRAFT_1975079 [Mycena galopus ATCC 62051]